MDNTDLEFQEEIKHYEQKHNRGKIMGGLLIVVIGTLYLARELGVSLPEWLLSWKMLLIGLGVVSAIKHKFMHPVWVILIGAGTALILSDLYPEMHLKPLLWPMLLIALGFYIMFKPRRNFKHLTGKKWQHWHHHKHQYGRAYYGGNIETEELSNDYLESVCVFGGVKKNIVSKSFKGGEVVIVFSGTELNLMQSDIEESASLEITQVFGGTKLIVPANWTIKSEMVTVIGSVEDKRPLQNRVNGETEKILVLTGVVILGGVEIKSY
ncbi:MAG: hypothetical protein IT236_05340 [Bacteroidia bacterium]|nr:hypothetical protein [Bacteroidia bacterium]